MSEAVAFVPAGSAAPAPDPPPPQLRRRSHSPWSGRSSPAASSSCGRTSCARSLTLTLLMLGVFALVVMTSVLDGVKDKVVDRFRRHELGRHARCSPQAAQDLRGSEALRHEPGLRYEDLPRLTAPHPKVLGFSPRATQAERGAGGRRHRADLRQRRHRRATRSLMDRPIGLGRGLTEDDERRRSTVAVVGATLGLQALRRRRSGGAGHGDRGRAASASSACWRRARSSTKRCGRTPTACSIPLETYMDRIDTDHQLTPGRGEAQVQAGPRRGLRDDARPRPAGPPRHRGRARSRTSTPSWRAATRTSRTRCTAGPWCCSAWPARCCWWAASGCCR